MRAPKNRRQHLVVKILGTKAVTSQRQLTLLLAAEGMAATQATVSRDLEELGAMKARPPGGDRPVYMIAELPKDQPAPEEHLRRVLGEWVVDVASSGNLVVLRTPPGCAHVVASALDRSGAAGVLGTVAGDDTVLVVAAARVSGAALAARISRLAGVTKRRNDGG
jgi:transcriptional regulator of arginine metabolism